MIEKSGELLRTRKLIFGFYKLLKLSWPDKETLGSQKNLFYEVGQSVHFERKLASSYFKFCIRPYIYRRRLQK